MTLHFPDANTINQYLSNHPSLKLDFYQEKGITKAIAELVASKFANSEMDELGVQQKTTFLINDLRNGKDGYTGRPIPNLEKLGLSFDCWNQIRDATKKALVDCAKNYKAQELRAKL